MITTKDPMGAAIADYFKTGTSGKLGVFSPDFDEDQIPLETLFRDFDNMPALEQTALRMASGQILDVGAGAGCHSLVLQDMGKDVDAIDISPLSVETMISRGVRSAAELDFWAVEKKYDTILMMMNGIGIVGTVDALPRFFHHIGEILNDEGQVLLDSSDICYLYEFEDGIIELPSNGYYGEIRYQMKYKKIKGDMFPWLYIDFETLAESASQNGFVAEIVQQGDHYDYLARLRKA